MKMVDGETGDIKSVMGKRLPTNWLRLTRFLIRMRFIPITFDGDEMPTFQWFSINTALYFIIYPLTIVAGPQIFRVIPAVNKSFNLCQKELIKVFGDSPTDIAAVSSLGTMSKRILIFHNQCS